MIAVVLAACAAALAGADVVLPREASWKELLERGFEPEWILPAAPSDPGQVDLAAQTRALLALRCDPVPEHGWCSFGDLARDVHALRSEPVRCASLVSAWLAGGPRVSAFQAALVRSLLRDDRLYSEDWNPDRGAPDDGLFFAPPWDLSTESRRPWSRLRGNDEMQQAAALVRADLDAIKDAQNDYPSYRGQPGAVYERIEPVPRSYLRGLDGDGRPFAALDIEFACDLPFPFGGYECRLSILERLAPDGSLTTAIYSRSKDFLWLAGADVFLPVVASDGEWVGTLLVRRYGFDLRGVPDKSTHRQAALRASLGNLVREASRRFAARADGARSAEGRIPAFRVLGGA